MSNKTYFVTGATGRQGGAVARKLLYAGFQVKALVRNPEKAEAQQVAKHGATLIVGDYTDLGALEQAAKGCHGLFLNLVATNPPELETTHASNAIAAARKAGVKRIVYSSSARVEQHESFTTWDPNGTLAGGLNSKTKIQEMVQAAGFEAWTILQPAWIMTNWVSPVAAFYWPQLSSHKTMLSSFLPDTVIDLTAPEDIGSFAVEALTIKGYDQKVIKIAGDQLTIGQCADVMGKIGGVEVHIAFREEGEDEEQKGSNPLVASQLWQRFDGCGVDLEEVRSFCIPLTTFEEFLGANREALLAAVRGASSA